MNKYQEDYLKTIYGLGGDKKIVSNKAIIAELNLSPASVTEMLSKLMKKGLVKAYPYKGAQLTEKGIQAAREVALSHRLWEVFLTEHLGYSWSEAHEDAHILEHVAPDRLLQRLDTFLNYPEHCPHGGEIIRGKSGKSRKRKSYVLISNLLPGERAVVRKIVEKSALLDYLEKRGLKIDAEIEIISIDKDNGAVTLKQAKREIIITHKAATEISVERVAD